MTDNSRQEIPSPKDEMPLHDIKRSCCVLSMQQGQSESHYIRTQYLLTQWCRVLLEKLTGLQLVKKFPSFYGARRFIIALTNVRHLSLSWASPIQSIYPHPTYWRSNLILSTHLRLGLPSGLLPSGFPTKTLYTSLSSPIHDTCPTHLIIFGRNKFRNAVSSNSRIILGVLTKQLRKTVISSSCRKLEYRKRMDRE